MEIYAWSLVNVSQFKVQQLNTCGLPVDVFKR